MILNDTPIQLLTQHVQVLSNLNINPTLNIIQLLLSYVTFFFIAYSESSSSRQSSDVSSSLRSSSSDMVSSSIKSIPTSSSSTGKTFVTRFISFVVKDKQRYLYIFYRQYVVCYITMKHNSRKY